MDLKEIQTIIKNFEKSEMTFLDLEVENLKLKLSKSNNFSSSTTNLTDDAFTVKKIEDATCAQNINSAEIGFDVKSPLIGTFYASSSPTEKPFVSLNQKVEKGQTLCIIEAMKIMNEIIAPISGTIVSVKANSGDPIGFDQVLMTIV